MRTIKQLLQLMLDNKHLFKAGLCGWNSNLPNTTTEEFYLIKNYIKNNRPINLYLIFSDRRFYWKPGNIKPRIKWLEHHISIN